MSSTKTRRKRPSHFITVWHKEHKGDLTEIKHKIVLRLKEFSEVQPEHYQKELSLCLLTPQTSPYRADACIQVLDGKGFFNGEPFSEPEVSKILRNPLTYVRFHNVKAKRLLMLRKEWSAVKDILMLGLSPVDEREKVLSIVDGFGMKEASHALRNIGRKNLAILDRHILNNLKRLRVIKNVPRSLSVSAYRQIEEKFLEFGKDIGESIDVLDLYFWSRQTGSIFK